MSELDNYAPEPDSQEGQTRGWMVLGPDDLQKLSVELTVDENIIVEEESGEGSSGVIVGGGFHVFVDEGDVIVDGPSGHPDFGSGPSDPSPSGAGVGSPAGSEGGSSSTTTDDASQPTGGLVPHFVVVPESIQFFDVGDNWMALCVIVNLVLLINGVPVTHPVEIGFRPSVPKSFTKREAQLKTALAASEAAVTVKEGLDLGLLSPADAGDRFRFIMNDFFSLHAPGSSVAKC